MVRKTERDASATADFSAAQRIPCFPWQKTNENRPARRQNQLFSKNWDKPRTARTSRSSLTAGWAHVAIVYDDTKATVYVDGVACGSVTIAPVAAHATNFELCSSVCFPRADECRLMKGAASADWVKAEYDTVKKSDFLTCKSQGFILFVR